MSNKDSGFTILEMLVVVLVIGIIVAMAIPQALIAVKAYRLHTDTAAVAAQLNVTRFRATSQNAPFRLNIVTTTSPATFTMERLCGGTPVGTDSSCTGSAYLPRTSGIEGGVQVIAVGNSFTTTNPGGSTYPGTITGGSAATTFYFNTRGMPVTSSGNPLSNGGEVIYVTNNAGLTDAVVVTVGGRISTYQWRPRPTPGAWTSR